MNNQPIVNAPGPLREMLDDYARMPEGRRTAIAATLAVILHLSAFLTGGYFILKFERDRAAKDEKKKPAEVVKEEKKKPLEVTVIIPEVAAPEPAPAPKPVEFTKTEEMLLQERFRMLPEEIQREYVDVDGLAKAKNLSKRALLESWEDSVAGSKLPGKGDGPLPTKDGRRDLAFADFKNQDATLGNTPAENSVAALPPQLPTASGSEQPIFQPRPIKKEDLQPAAPNRPVPKVADIARPRETKPVEPKPTPPPARLQLAKLTPPPPPSIKKSREATEDEIPLFLDQPEPPKPEPPPAEKTPDIAAVKLEPQMDLKVLEVKPRPIATPSPTQPQPPKPRDDASMIKARLAVQDNRPQAVANPGYQPNKVLTQNDGGKAPPGADGVDAIATATGKYKKSMNSTVGSRWTYYVTDARFNGMLAAGQTTVHFVIDASGKLLRAKVTENNANALHAQLCKRAFIESQRDFDPPPKEILQNGRYEDSFTFVLY